jgi:mannose-6-phosphate isomerase-like protein (cupin superfamily)
MTVPFNYPLDELLKAHAASGRLYYEFLRVPDMSAGLYLLPADGQDPQQPHHEDEIYYVIRGKGKFFCDGQNFEIEAGSSLYVPKEIEHRFHSITEDLVLLVFFAPAES